MSFKVIGVTGPIVSGKTTFCKFLEDFGFYHIETDLVAKEIYREEHIKRWLKSTFGSEIFGMDGMINFRTLGRIIFNDIQNLKKLEDYVHPVVLEIVKNRVSELKGNRGMKGVAIEAVKLFESGSDRVCDVSISIICNRKAQIERLNRRGLSFSKIMAIFACQKSSYFYSQLSDCVIENNGSLKELEEKSKVFLREKVFKDGKV